MGVIPNNYGFLTPICNACGIHLCWDLTTEEYEERSYFWDDWKCEECKED